MWLCSACDRDTDTSFNPLLPKLFIVKVSVIVSFLGKVKMISFSGEVHGQYNEM